MKANHLESSLEINFLSKIKALVALMKLRLSSLVVLSAFFGYFMAKGDLTSWSLCHLLLGGLLITGSSNGFNQLLEIKTDLLMKRTINRPLPSKVLSKLEAILFSSIIGFIGLWLLYLVNYKSLMLGLFSMITYVIIYTPLKKKSSIAVFVFINNFVFFSWNSSTSWFFCQILYF